MAAINTIKAIADATFGRLNKGTKFLLERIDPGSKNLFTMIMYPKSVDDLSLGFGGMLDIAIDTLVANVYLRTADVPFLSVEYETQGELKAPKKLNYPDSVTISLLEDEFGLMRNYLYGWLNSIVFPVDEQDDFSGILRTNYVFTDAQEAAKKNAILISQSGLGLPSLRSIRFYGLKFQSIDTITFGHGEADPLIYNVTCAVDSVWFGFLF